MPFVTVRNGLIQTWKVEFNLAEHCNFACDGCSHLSPYLPPRLADSDQFRADLEALARVLRVRRFRFVGGEPLLHPRIGEFIGWVRESGIARNVQVVTNGALLARMDDAFFGSIDMLSVSWYPDPRCTPQSVERARRLCRLHGTKLKIERISRFRQMEVRSPLAGAALGHVWRTCQMAHTWYCQTFHEGRFYLCSRPVFSGGVLARRGESVPDLRAADGLEIHAPHLQDRLLRYLGRRAPLASCAWCLGSIGAYQDWKPLSAQERRSPQAPQAAEFDSKRLHYLDAWATAEHIVHRVVPSLRVARAVQIVKNLPVRD